MAKVTLNKSTKIKGKGLVLAGVEVEVTADEEKQLKKDGFLGEVKKSNKPTNEKEINDLVAKVESLEKELENSSDKELKAENKTLKAENEDLRKTLVELAGDKEENKGFLSKFGLGK